MSDLNLENIVGFKAVDKNGNERQVTVDEMTELVSARIVSAASEISTFAAAAAAGTDEFEDQLPQSDTFSWLRTLDGSKNPTLTSSSAAAKVLGGLLPIPNIKSVSKNINISTETVVTLVTLALGEVCLLSISDGGYTVVISLSATQSNTIKYSIISGELRGTYKLSDEGLNLNMTTSEARTPRIRYIIF
ncbi:hypothetical protein PL658_20830 [Phocaeicola vulgatus]|uniref:hypothetical protein n=4 Tax=Phocaeicola vulgatus TaxID=821 RepID=UPI002306F08F|nr:hypothetical protein [Phocaeicola vulgatus]MDB0944992.1 hypothetical protein [Phocaeicola vulgatus]MDB0953541.1 hypothetical protein [Phocaeicola vulgatus]MDB0957756.1 hypothetical protein [Phocaeicola vulgatus]MDB0970435.1 hypothetical protein [Phocaeicola vulgatus]